MSDTFSFLNWLKIYDVDRGAKGEQHLNDLRERASYIASKTGEHPITWYEFQQSQPRQDQPHYLRNILAGVIIGTAIGAGIGLLAGAILGAVTVGGITSSLVSGFMMEFGFAGAVSGGSVGAFADTANKRRDAMVSKYENYLNNFEVTHGRAPVRAPSVSDEQSRYAEQVLAEREAAKAATRQV